MREENAKIELFSRFPGEKTWVPVNELNPVEELAEILKETGCILGAFYPLENGEEVSKEQMIPPGASEELYAIVEKHLIREMQAWVFAYRQGKV